MADEAEITLNNNSSIELVQPFEIKSTADSTSTNNQTLEVKPLSQTLEVKPLNQTSTENQTLEVKPLTQTSTNDQTLEIKPVNIDSRQELAVTEPIRTDANSTLDLKPLVIDVCSRTGQAPLPPTHVCQPYEHRVGFTVMGMELFGLTLCGENQTIVEDRPGRPTIAWGPVQSARHTLRRPYEPDHHDHHEKPGHGHGGWHDQDSSHRRDHGDSGVVARPGEPLRLKLRG